MDRDPKPCSKSFQWRVFEGRLKMETNKYGPTTEIVSRVDLQISTN